MKAAPKGSNITGNDPIEDGTAVHEPDMVFRVSLPTVDQPVESLEEFYREALKDLLEVVRFSFRGEPMLVDGFAFRNRPDRVIPILREDDHGAA
jgi:hypothetical protein